MIARTVARMPNSNVNFVFKSMVIGALLAGKEAEYLYENAITHALTNATTSLLYTFQECEKVPVVNKSPAQPER